MRNRIGDGEWIPARPPNGGLIAYPGWSFPVRSRSNALEYSMTRAQYEDYKKIEGDADTIFVQCSATGYLLPLVLCPLFTRRYPGYATAALLSLGCGTFGCQPIADRITRYRRKKASETYAHLDRTKHGYNPLMWHANQSRADTELFFQTIGLGPLPFPRPLPSSPLWTRGLRTHLTTLSWRWQRWYHSTFWTARMNAAYARFFNLSDVRTMLTQRWRGYFRDGEGEDVVEIETATTFTFQYGRLNVQLPSPAPHAIYAQMHLSPNERDQIRTWAIRQRRESLRNLTGAAKRLTVLEAEAEKYVKEGAMEARDFDFEIKFATEWIALAKDMDVECLRWHDSNHWYLAVAAKEPLPDDEIAEGSTKDVLRLSMSAAFPDANAGDKGDALTTGRAAISQMAGKGKEKQVALSQQQQGQQQVKAGTAQPGLGHGSAGKGKEGQQQESGTRQPAESQSESKGKKDDAGTAAGEKHEVKDGEKETGVGK